MPSGVRPLSGLRGFVNPSPETSADARSGGVADPKHGQAGEVARPFPYERNFPGAPHGPYGVENQLLGEADWYCYTEPAGQLRQDPTADETPITHAAPWPKGRPNTTDPGEQAARLVESEEIHSSDMGGWREGVYLPTANPVQPVWQESWNDIDAGMTNPAMQELPSQLLAGGSGGWGSRDRVQSYARQNEYGFDSAHMHRRVVPPGGNSLPGNYMWMDPGSRPLVKSIPGTAGVPMGPDTPYYGQNPGQGYDVQGAVLMDLPTEYQAPPEPALAASYPAGEASTEWEVW